MLPAPEPGPPNEVPGDQPPDREPCHTSSTVVRRSALSHLAAGVGGGLVVLVVLVGGGLLPLGGGGPSTAPPSAAPASSPTASPSPGPAFVDGATVGRADAPLEIEVWADFQCPFCRLFSHGIEPELVRTYAATGRARITFRDFAFLGRESLEAAVAARCAARQGAFWRYHDLLFASQRGENEGAFRREVLLSLADVAGLDGPSFAACLDDPELAAAVIAETAEGRRLGIDSTPTLRLVGPGGTELLRGLVGFADLAAAVERILRPPPSGASPGTNPGPSAGPSGSAPVAP